MSQAIVIYTRQLDPTAFEGTNWAARMDRQYEAAVPAGQLPQGSDPIVVHNVSRDVAIKVAKARVKKLLAGRGPVRFKVVDEND